MAAEKYGGDACSRDPFVIWGEAFNELFGFYALDGFIENGIRIKVIHDEDEVISSAGDKREAQREIITYESVQAFQL